MSKGNAACDLTSCATVSNSRWLASPKSPNTANLRSPSLLGNVTGAAADAACSAASASATHVRNMGLIPSSWRRCFVPRSRRVCGNRVEHVIEHDVGVDVHDDQMVRDEPVFEFVGKLRQLRQHAR